MGVQNSEVDAVPATVSLDNNGLSLATNVATGIHSKKNEGKAVPVLN
jgi:hypothetical protein